MPDDATADQSEIDREPLLKLVQSRVSVAQAAGGVREAFGRHPTVQWVVLSALVRPTLESPEWRSFATTLRPAPTEEDAWHQARDIHFGLMRLTSRPVTQGDLKSDRDFAQLLEVDRIPLVSKLQPEVLTAIASRQMSRNPFSVDPCWVVTWTLSDERTMVGVPAGPFFNAEDGRVFESVGRAFATWSGDDQIAVKDHPEALYRVIIPDATSRLVDARVVEDGVRVEIVRSTDRPLFATAVAREGAHRTSLSAPIVGTEALLPVPNATRSLRLMVFDSAGVLCDDYEVHDYRPLPGISLIQPDGGWKTEAQSALIAAMRDGEGERTEFKPWFHASRGEGKAREFLDTVVAFTNNRGGTLWVGVGDRTAVIGTDVDLRKRYGSESNGDLTRAETLYQQDLLKLVIEGVTPRAPVQFEWFAYVSYRLLRVTVERGSETPYALAENGDILIRRDGSNRKPTPDELRALVQRRSTA